MTIKDCPQPDQLKQFLLGVLPGEESEQIESHFENCESCLEQAEKISSEDTLTHALADRETNSILSNLKIKKSVEKISESTVTKLSEKTATEKTILTPSPDQQKVGDEDSHLLLHFLSPAEADDELGRLGG